MNGKVTRQNGNVMTGKPNGCSSIAMACCATTAAMPKIKANTATPNNGE
jgi:hypothetical protein